MNTKLSAESANWVRRASQPTLSSTVPTFDNELPIGVHREGLQNYVKNRGSFSLTWNSVDASRPATPQTPRNLDREIFPGQARPAKVIGEEAKKNYVRNVTSTPQLLFSGLQPPDPHHRMRVKREGRENYVRDRDSRVKLLLENYGKLAPPTPTRPRTQGELARNLYETHNEGRLGPMLSHYGRFPSSPRAAPHVKGDAAEANLRKGLGDTPILEHRLDHRLPTPEPHVTGSQALETYEKAQGGAMNNLIHHYGHLPRSARTIPKVKFDGIRVHDNAQGDAMRKCLSQKPPSYRYRERPLPVPQ